MERKEDNNCTEQLNGCACDCGTDGLNTCNCSNENPTCGGHQKEDEGALGMDAGDFGMDVGPEFGPYDTPYNHLNAEDMEPEPYITDEDESGLTVGFSVLGRSISDFRLSKDDVHGLYALLGKYIKEYSGETYTTYDQEASKNEDNEIPAYDDVVVPADDEEQEPQWVGVQRGVAEQLERMKRIKEKLDDPDRVKHASSRSLAAVYKIKSELITVLTDNKLYVGSSRAASILRQLAEEYDD